MTLTEKSEDGARENFYDYENSIRAVVAAAIEAGTIERGSKWFDMTLEEYLATPLRAYAPPRHRRSAR